MEKRNLEVIKFHLSRKGDKKEEILMSEIEDEDLIDIVFNEFVPFIDDYPTDDRNKRVVKLFKQDNGDSFFKKKDGTRTVSGVIETGKYGKEENVVDVDKADNEPVFKIHKNHSVQKPFFFLICISNLKKNGIIILERDGVLGIKQVFTRLLKDFIKYKFEDYTLHLTNFIDHQIVKNYIEKGEYNSIKLIRHSLPYDVAERYGLDRLETEDFVLELTIKTKGRRKILGSSRRRIQEIFESNDSGFFASEELNDVGFDEKSIVKVNSTYNNSSRTIDLSDTMKFKPYYEVDVAMNATGHSEFNSIEKEALNLLEDLNLDLYSK
jgi:hypothetical protein